mmetsp:Transcript_6335/g.7718  ORF Transcript_6335/g.7718 Transcript_6335/m.7718 type:complete len:425 (+) Transcript_6335:123-1397(+)
MTSELRKIEFRPPKTSDDLELEQGSCRSVHSYSQFCRIGEGTYGTVYRAIDKTTNKIVALKKVILHNEKQVGFPITSLREVRLLKRLSHINCVSLLDVAVGKARDQIFLVFEYCEHDMATLMETMGKKWTESEVKCLMIQLLKAVEYLHDNWIIHRDLKMSNLLYNSQGQLKVADFGLARLYSSSNSSNTTHTIKVMTPKVVTLWYRAPELLLGEINYNLSIDIWSCGCIFGELLRNGTPLLPGKDESDQINLIFNLLGKPNENIWKNISKLPLVEKGIVTVNGTHSKSESDLSNRFLDWGYDCIEFLQDLLKYDPSLRINAREALRHPYFKSRPLPQQPQFMPTYPTQHAPLKQQTTTIVDGSIVLVNVNDKEVADSTKEEEEVADTYPLFNNNPPSQRKPFKRPRESGTAKQTAEDQEEGGL